MLTSFTIPTSVFLHPDEEVYPALINRLSPTEIIRICCLATFSGIYKPELDSNELIEQIMNMEESIVQLLLLQRMFNDDDDILIKVVAYISSVVINIRGHIPHGFYTYRMCTYIPDNVIVIYDYDPY
jgi:hypothetical protein